MVLVPKMFCQLPPPSPPACRPDRREGVLAEVLLAAHMSSEADQAPATDPPVIGIVAAPLEGDAV
eukprot:69847-Prorocentrum_lima.AAC.1